MSDPYKDWIEIGDAPTHSVDALGSELITEDHSIRVLVDLHHDSRGPETETGSATNVERLSLVRSFASQHGLRMADVYPLTSAVVLEGKLSGFSKAFGVTFANVERGGSVCRSHRQPVRIPPTLSGTVRAVAGLEEHGAPRRPEHAVRLAGHQKASPMDLSTCYQFPVGLNGEGEWVAIVALGGGYYQSDLDAYFQRLGLASPHVEPVKVSGPGNNPAPMHHLESVIKSVVSGKSESLGDVLPTVETTMDIELLGAIANRAKVVVYFSEADEAGVGLTEAFHAAVNDRQRRPSVISCSWGIYEECCGKPQVHSLERALEFASTMSPGITITCASGDWGDGVDAKGHPRVMYPASSPFVLACGGTNLDFSRPSKESVWNEEPAPHVRLSSGGGISRLFGLPSWQESAGVPSQAGTRGRGVPDVAARANLLQGLELLVGGQTAFVGGGTSAAAPVWAGLIARLNQGLKSRLGYLNPRLYGTGLAQAFHDITEGGNGHFTARSGWDACTGLGRPIGDALFAALRET